MARRMPARTQCEKSPQRQPSFSDNDVEFKETSCLAVVVGSPFGGLQVPVVIAERREFLMWRIRQAKLTAGG
jgi:hypothetical protein